jgi:uncharacterized membrane protein
MAAPQQQRAVVRAQAAFQVQSGPTPPPEHIEVYERLAPGSANRFLTLAEDEAKHRRTHENAHLEIVKANAGAARIQTYVGQAMAFTIAMVGMWITFQLANAGHTVPASVVGCGSLGALIAPFLRSGRTDPPAK